jgi:multiple sugar transport system substrate-binding protein
VPYTVGASMNHIWRPLVEKAGYQMSDIPKTWDAYYDFFKDVQKKLRAQGARNVYGLGFQLNTAGNDSNARANDFIIAYGGRTSSPRTANCTSTIRRCERRGSRC